MKNNRLVIPSNLDIEPEKHEIAVAKKMAQHFHSDVIFIQRSTTSRTADIKVGSIVWEIKSIKGHSKRTIQNNLRKAANQAKHIVIDLSRTKMTSKQAIGRINEALVKSNFHLKKIFLLTKAGKLVEFPLGK
jgi:hypothetical protein